MDYISFEEYKKRRQAGESAQDIMGTTAQPAQATTSQLPSFDEYVKRRRAGESAEDIMGRASGTTDQETTQQTPTFRSRTAVVQTPMSKEQIRAERPRKEYSSVAQIEYDYEQRVKKDNWDIVLSEATKYNPLRKATELIAPDFHDKYFQKTVESSYKAKKDKKKAKEEYDQSKNEYLYKQLAQVEGKDWKEKYANVQAQFEDAKQKYGAADAEFKSIAGYITDDMAQAYAQPIEDARNSAKFDMEEKLALMDYAKLYADAQERHDEESAAKAAGMTPMEWYGKNYQDAQTKADEAKRAMDTARGEQGKAELARDQAPYSEGYNDLTFDEQLAITDENDRRVEEATKAGDAAEAAYNQAMEELAAAKQKYLTAGKTYGDNAAADSENEGRRNADKRASTLYYSKYAEILDRPDYREKSRAMKEAPDKKYGIINKQRDVSKINPLEVMDYKYEFMTDDERGVYNYLYATEGKKAANEFLDSIDAELNAQYQSGINYTIADWSKDNKFAASALSVGLAPIRAAGSVIANTEDFGKVLAGDKYEIDPNGFFKSLSHETNAARSAVQEDFTKAGQFAYNTAMSAGDSAAITAATAGVGSALGLSGSALMAFTNKASAAAMSSDVMSMSIAEGKEKGYSDIGAYSLGAARGGIEYMSEKIGGEWVIKYVKANPGNFANVLFRSMVPEGIEEVMSDVGNEAVNAYADAVFGTEESYIGSAYREFEARGSANPLADTIGVILLQEAQSFAGGALATVGNASVQYVTNSSAINSAANRLNTSPEEIVKLMQDTEIENPAAISYLADLNNISTVNDFLQMVETYTDVQEAVDEAMRIRGSGAEVRANLLREAGVGSVSNQVESAWDVLTGKVSPEESRAKSEAALKKIGFTNAQTKEAIDRNQYVNRITKLDMATAFASAQDKLKAAGVEDQRMATAITAVALQKQAERKDATGNLEPTKYQQRLVSESELAQRIVREIEAEAIFEEKTEKVSWQDMKADVKLNGESAEIVGVKDGKVQVLQNGETKTVALKDLEGMPDSYRKLVDLASSMEGGTDMLKSYQPGQNVRAYAIAWNRAYSLYGAQTEMTAEKAREVGKGSLAALTDSQLLRAITLGRQNAQEKGIAKRGALTGKLEFYQGGKLEGVEYDAVTEEEARELLGDAEMSILTDVLAKSVNITLVKSKTDSKGRYQGAQGIFYRDGRIYLDVNAGMLDAKTGQRTIVLTAAHELTHYIRAYNPEGYKALRAFVTNELANKGLSLERLIAQKQARSDKKLSYDEAMEEVIADSCETMLTDPKALAQFASQNPAAARTMNNWLDKFLAKIENALKRLKAAHTEALAMQDRIDDLRKLWYEALVKANENATLGIGEDSEGAAMSAREASDPTDAVQDVQTDSGFGAAIESKDSGVYSLRTFEDTGRAALNDFLDRQVASKALTAKEADQMRDQMEMLYRICKEYDNGNYAPFSAWSNAEVVTYDGRPVFSVVKQNGEYKLNLDFSLVCKKRRTLDAVFNEMIRRGIMNDFKMGPGSIAKINQIIREHGFETACGLCFVDSKRYRQAMIADAFCAMYNMQVFSLMKGTGAKIAWFNYGGDETITNPENTIDAMADDKLNWSKVDDILKNEKKGTVKYKIAEYLKNNPSARKLVTRGDFMSTAGFDALKANNPDLLSLYNSKKGAGGPKAAQSDVQYLNEIIESKSFNEKAAYEVGGVRIQSFSDYVGRLVFDYVQMVADLSAKKLPAHSYTKEFMFAQQFGLTGIKINMSLVPAVVKGGVAAGLDADGNYTWKDGQSFGSTVYDNKGKRLSAEEGFQLAIKIQNAKGYSKNCGTIAVGVSDAHINKMLDDANIKMIIPYHKSGLNHLVAAMEQIDKYTDYTNVQNTRSYKNGKWSKIGPANEFNFNEALQKAWAEGKGAKEAADEYLAWCKENGYKPKFDEFAAHPNYYKLLEDFNCYDSDGVTSTPMGAVQMNFPTESDAFGSMKDLIKSGLEEDAMLQAKQEGGVNDIVDEVQAVLPAFEEGQKGKHADRDNADPYNKYDKDIKGEDVRALRTINNAMRLSVNNFTREDLIKTKKWAHKYYQQLGEKSPFFRAWFGEWRAHDNTPIAVATIPGKNYTDKSVSQYNSEKKGNYEVYDTRKTPDAQGWMVRVSHQGPGGSYGHARQDMLSVIGLSGLDDLLHNSVLLQSETHEVDHGGHPTKEQLQSDMHAFDHKLYALGRNSFGEIALYKITVEDLYEGKNNQNSMIFHNLRYVEKVGVIKPGAEKITAVESNHGLTDSQKRTAETAEKEDSTATYTVADLYRFVKKYDKKFEPNLHDSIDTSLLDKNGMPRVVYHQTGADFDVFNTDNPVAGANDSETPNGIFFKTNDHDIGLEGKKQMPVYISAHRLLHFADRSAANEWYQKHIPGYRALQDEMNKKLDPIDKQIDELDDRYFLKEEISEEEYDDKWSELLAQMKSVEDSYRGRLRKLLDDYFIRNNSGYDGIELEYDGHRYIDGKRENVHTFIVFKNTQVKSATDNIGTFDRSDANIKHSDRDNLGYHAGDLGKAEHLNIQGRSRGTGHFGTGTYFVGVEEKVTKDIHYGKRPQHAVDFSDYNLYRVRNDRDGYRLHDALKIIDGGIKKEWISPAIQNEFNIINPTGYYDIAKSKYGEDWTHGDNLLNAQLEFAKENGIDVKSLEEFKAEEGKGIDDEDLKYYYEDYVKDTLKEKIDEANAEYREFRDAVFGLNLLTGLKDAKIYSALKKVADYQKTTPRDSKSDSYATVFMKAMGYDGVDVRGTGLDNTAYGSVIYDVKPETVRYSLRDTEAVRRQQAKDRTRLDALSDANTIRAEERLMRESLNKWKRMPKRTEGKTVSNSDMDSAANSLTNEFNSTVSKEAVRGQLKDLANWLIESNSKDINYDELQKRALAIANDIAPDEATAEWAKVEIIDRVLDEVGIKRAKSQTYEATKKHYQDMIQRQRNKRSDTAVRGKIKKLHKEISDMLLKPKEGRYVPRELVKMTADILGAVDPTSNRAVKAKAAMAELKVRYDALSKDTKYALTYDETVSGMIQQLAEDMTDKNIYDLTGGELEALYNTLKALKHTIQTANKLVGAKIEADAFEAANQMMRETENAKGIPTKMLRKFVMSQLTPSSAFRMFGGYVKNSMWSQMYEMLNNGQLTQTQILMEGGNIFRELIDDKKNLKALHNQKELVDIGLKDDQGNPIKVTRGMMLSVYMHLQNEQNAKHVAYGGLTVPRLAQYYKNQMKDAYTGETGRAVAFATEIAELNRQLEDAETAEEQEAIKERLAELNDETDAYMSNLRSQIEEQLTEYDRKWIAAAKQFFDVYSKGKLNEVTEMVYGFEKAQVDNYFPIHTDQKYRTDSFDTITRDMSLENAGFMKERVNGANPIQLEDITDVISSQLRRTAQYCGLMPAIRNFNKAYGKARDGYQMSVKEAISRTFLNDGLKYIENLMADLNGARKGEPNIFDELRGNMAGAVLTLNPRVALSQTASFPSAAAEIGYKPLMKALTDMKNPMWDKGLQEEISKWTPLWWYRMQGYSTAELGDIKNNEQLMKRAMDRFKWATGWIQAMDGYATGGLWQASKYYVDENFSNLEKGSDEYMMKVAETFNRVIEKTQPDYTTMQRPDILRNPNAIVKQLTMFMTQRLQNTNILFDAAATYAHYVRDADAGRNGVTAEDVKQARTRLVWAVSSQATASATIVIFKAIADAIMHNLKAYRDDDDELTAESISKTLLINFAETVTGNVLWGSEAFSWLKSAITGERYYGVSLNGVETFKDTLSDANKTLQKLIKGDIENAAAPAWSLAKSVAQFFGVPLGNMEKFAKMAENYYKDAANGTFMESDVDRTRAQNTHILYRALREGDREKADRIRGEFKNKKDAQSALKSYIRELYAGQEISKAEVSRYLVKYCGMTERDAKLTTQEWTMEVTTGVKYSDLKDEFISGNISQPKAVKYLMTYGSMSEADATAKVQEWMCEKKTGIAYSDIGNEVKTGRMSAEKAIDLMVEYGGKDTDAATKTVNGYLVEYEYGIRPSDLEEEYVSGNVTDDVALDILTRYKYYGKADAETKAADELERLKFIQENPDAEDISITQVRNYNASGLKGTISAADYARAAKMMGTFTGTDLDNNGKTDPFSVVMQKLEYIDKMDLTSEQKTELAKALGISASTIRRRAPWNKR